ncbi:MAG: hypothetical protein A2Z35_05870 [Actinobacteria bacterium RBG_19FT_COMBO_36_27]|nr:MAG: hypothetical protein A2Z35_05870 [Actinobacteria bacterium RBG_19FT_COMBO_36_27]
MDNFLEEPNNEQGELDYAFENEIEELQMAEKEAGRYIYVCKLKIKEWEDKLKKAEERIEYRKDCSKHNIYNLLNKAIVDGVVGPESIKEGSQTTYTIPSAKLIFHKEEEQIEMVDENKLLLYLKDNSKWDYLSIKENVKWDEFRKTIRAKDGNIIDEHGEILESIKGLNITTKPSKFEIKYLGKKK